MQLTEAQILAFRAHRQHLAGPGAPSVVEAARAQLGAQAQIENPALLGLSQRCAARPAQDETREALARREVVRTWGPRDTVHIFPPEIWPLVVAARPEWGKSGRQPDPWAARLLDDARAHVATLDRVFTREDLRPLVPPAWMDAIPTDYFDTEDKRWRYATGRLIWRLSKGGWICHGPMVGKEQGYLPRTVAFPDLAFPELDPLASNQVLVQRYLASYGPATVQDIAHFFGAKVSSARAWIADLALLEVRCGDRTLLARPEDADALPEERPLGVRMLPGYDQHLMGHADKSLLVPHAPDAKQIWRKAAVLAAIVWDRGRAVATYKQKVLSKRVDFTVTPLSGWTSPDLTAEARAIAAHLGRQESRVLVP